MFQKIQIKPLTDLEIRIKDGPFKMGLSEINYFEEKSEIRSWSSEIDQLWVPV